jgi:hypothetical protein
MKKLVLVILIILPCLTACSLKGDKQTRINTDNSSRVSEEISSAPTSVSSPPGTLATAGGVQDNASGNMPLIKNPTSTATTDPIEIEPPKIKTPTSTPPTVPAEFNNLTVFYA